MKMKKFIFMAAMAMLASACGSETPDMPGKGEDGPSAEIVKPNKEKKNPTLADMVNFNKKIAEAFGGKSNGKKEELSSYFEGFSYESSSFKNNKYTITFTDGQQTVIDLNAYKSESHENHSDNSRTAVQTRGETDKNHFSNAKVFLWEPAPFGDLVNQQIGNLLDEYIGKENVKRISGESCTWQSLMDMPEYAITVINGLGVDGKWIVTGQQYTSALDYTSMKDYIGIYTAMVDGVACHYYMVNDMFVSQCMAPLVQRGVVINASSSSAEGKLLTESFAKIGYTSYFGVDNTVAPSWAAETAAKFLTALMTEHTTTGVAFDNVNTAYEFKLDDNNTIKVSPVFSGDTNLQCPYTAYTDRMAITQILEHYKCDTSLTYQSLVDDGKIVLDYYNRVNMLDLSGCGLEGEIFDRFMWLDNLYMLSLDDNSLSGEIPAFMGEFPLLTALKLNDNQITGTIPATFERYYTNNGFINLTGNKMNGLIPFGKSTDNNIFFQFDHKYQKDYDGSIITNDYGLWFADEANY